MHTVSIFSPVTIDAHPAASTAASLPATGFVRQKLSLRCIPFSKPTLWRRINADAFPPPVRLSEGITAWRAEDVRRWIEERN